MIVCELRDDELEERFASLGRLHPVCQDAKAVNSVLGIKQSDLRETVSYGGRLIADNNQDFICCLAKTGHAFCNAGCSIDKERINLVFKVTESAYQSGTFLLSHIGKLLDARSRRNHLQVIFTVIRISSSRHMPLITSDRVYVPAQSQQDINIRHAQVGIQQ